MVHVIASIKYDSGQSVSEFKLKLEKENYRNPSSVARNITRSLTHIMVLTVKRQRHFTDNIMTFSVAISERRNKSIVLNANISKTCYHFQLYYNGHALSMPKLLRKSSGYQRSKHSR